MIIKEIMLSNSVAVRLSSGLNILSNISAADIVTAMKSIVDESESYLLCDEYLACKEFSEINRESYPTRLNKYLMCGDSYNPGEFEKRTNLLGGTKVFRAYLREYINGFKPELVDSEKSLWLLLDKTGKFHLKKRCKDGYIDFKPKERERFIFEYKCFLKINEFWEGACELRSLHKLMMPVIIDNVHGLDNKKDKSKIVKVIENSPFQIIAVAGLTASQ